MYIKLSLKAFLNYLYTKHAHFFCFHSVLNFHARPRSKTLVAAFEYLQGISSWILTHSGFELCYHAMSCYFTVLLELKSNRRNTEIKIFITKPTNILRNPRVCCWNFNKRRLYTTKDAHVDPGWWKLGWTMLYCTPRKWLSSSCSNMSAFNELLQPDTNHVHGMQRNIALSCLHQLGASWSIFTQVVFKMNYRRATLCHRNLMSWVEMIEKSHIIMKQYAGCPKKTQTIAVAYR